MKLTKKMKEKRNEVFITCKTIQQTKAIKDIINFTSSNMVFIKKTDTLLELAHQVDRVTNGQEYIVGWYTLDEEYLKISISFNHLNFYFYCSDILNTLENFLQVSCRLEEKQIQTTPQTVKSIICTKEN